MKKIIFLGVILTFLLAGCGEGSVDVGSGLEKGIDWISCQKYSNYKYIGGKCCRDLNQNEICEDDEPKPPICKDECNFPDTQCHKGDVYTCEDRDDDGCTEFNIKRSCADDETCQRGECVINVACGDGICDEGEENCDSCPYDCLGWAEICCDGISLNAECCIDSDCKENEQCDANSCAPIEFCGNSMCGEMETCRTCPEDCKLEEDEVCCEDTVLQGNCCMDENCDETETCMDNLCVFMEKEPEINSSPNETNNSNLSQLI